MPTENSGGPPRSSAVASIPPDRAYSNNADSQRTRVAYSRKFQHAVDRPPRLERNLLGNLHARRKRFERIE